MGTVSVVLRSKAKKEEFLAWVTESKDCVFRNFDNADLRQFRQLCVKFGIANDKTPKKLLEKDFNKLVDDARFAKNALDIIENGFAVPTAEVKSVHVSTEEVPIVNLKNVIKPMTAPVVKVEPAASVPSTDVPTAVTVEPVLPPTVTTTVSSVEVVPTPESEIPTAEELAYYAQEEVALSTEEYMAQFMNAETNDTPEIKVETVTVSSEVEGVTEESVAASSTSMEATATDTTRTNEEVTKDSKEVVEDTTEDLKETKDASVTESTEESIETDGVTEETVDFEDAESAQDADSEKEDNTMEFNKVNGANATKSEAFKAGFDAAKKDSKKFFNEFTSRVHKEADSFLGGIDKEVGDSAISSKVSIAKIRNICAQAADELEALYAMRLFPRASHIESIVRKYAGIVASFGSEEDVETYLEEGKRLAGFVAKVRQLIAKAKNFMANLFGTNVEGTIQYRVAHIFRSVLCIAGKVVKFALNVALLPACVIVSGGITVGGFVVKGLVHLFHQLASYVKQAKENRANNVQYDGMFEEELDDVSEEEREFSDLADALDR